MKRFIAALAVLCLSACEQRPSIRHERFVRSSIVDRNELGTDARMLWHRPPDPFAECEIGATRSCGLPRSRDGRAGPAMHCMLMADGTKRWARAECNTPLVVAFDASPVEFTRATELFTIGLDDRTEWVSAKTPWVALDRDGSGCIESARELFAGFESLAELDANGDGRIDARDPAFAELVLWSDRDQDKRCTPNELTSLASRLDALPLTYARREARATSYEGETAMLVNGARLVDVHLAPLD
jgi:hypothetical protein